jgi:hypothetical protein
VAAGFCQCASILEAAEVVGRITDADTGQSLQGAIIRAIPLARSLREVQTTSQSDGTYQLDLIRGKYRLFANLPGSDYFRSFILLRAKVEAM